MASNVLTATIKVNTQGVKQSFQETGTAAKKAAVDIKGIGGFATGAIAETKQVVKSLTAEISQLDATMLRSRGGQVLASELRAAKIELKALEAQAQISGGTGKNIASQLFSQVRQLAFILPGIGVAGLFNVAFEGAQKLVEGIFDVGEESKASAEKVKELRKAMDEAFSSSAKEATEVLSLAAVLKNETETRERRLGAIKELQRIQPDIFSGLKLEGDAVVGLDNAYKAYVANLRTVIAAKLVQAEIEQKLTELLKLQGVTLSKAQEGGIAAFKKLGDSARAADEKIGELAKPTKLKAFVDAFGKIRGTDFDFGADTEKRIKTLTDDVDGLAKKLQEFSLGIKVDIPKEKIAKVFEGIRVGIVDGLNNTVKLLELNPTPLSLPFQLALDENKLGLQFSALNEELRSKLNQFALKASSVPVIIRQQIIVDPNLKLPPDVRKGIETELKSQFASPINVDFDINAKPTITLDTTAIRQALQRDVGDALKQFAQEEFSAIGGFIGDAISGALDKNSIKNLIQPIADLLSNVGKALIKAGVALLPIQTVIKALGKNPALAIGLGIALIALSRVLANQINGQRALGGPVTKGKTYEVNERGQEIFQPTAGKPFLITGGRQLFSPPTSGKIIPHKETEKILKTASVSKVKESFHKSLIKITGFGAKASKVSHSSVINNISETDNHEEKEYERTVNNINKYLSSYAKNVSSTNRKEGSKSVKNYYSNLIKNISGHRATGGNVTHGNQYVVNENGNEIFQTSEGKAMVIQGGKQVFTPPVSGKIISHSETKKILNHFSSLKSNTSRVVNNISSSIRNISGHRAGGGPVVAGNNYIVNERGTEIFIPNTGRAINFNQSAATTQRGGISVVVTGGIEIAGSKILAVLENTKRSQRIFV